MGACEPVEVQSPMLFPSPQFNNIYICLVNKWTRGWISVAHYYHCKMKSYHTSFSPNLAIVLIHAGVCMCF